MRALDLGLPWSAHSRPVNHSRLRHVIITGISVGVVSTASFWIVHALGIVHALAIVPIWGQLARGLVPAVLAGVALAWAFDHLARIRGWHTPAHGAAFGLVMFATLAPATAATFVLTLASSGPIAVVNGARAAWLFAVL
jgi:hypothetical protein